MGRPYKWTEPEFWNKTWARPYGRYNKHHEAIWQSIRPILMFQGKVLDLGCGPAMMWKDKNVDLTGVDFSENAIIEARKNYPQGKFFVADARSTGLDDNQFDIIIMSGLLDYFSDWTLVLKEAERLIKPSGKILATLLFNFIGHQWNLELVTQKLGKAPSQFSHVCGNWYLLCV